MFREIMENDDAVIALVCESKLSQDDLNRMHALLHDRLAARTKPELLVHLRGSRATRNVAAMLESLKTDISHRNDFNRSAVVGERKWMEWAPASLTF